MKNWVEPPPGCGKDNMKSDSNHPIRKDHTSFYRKFDENYFQSDTYENVSFAKYSQYWWSNRFYAGIARRFNRTGGKLLEIGCGLGHLIGQLEDQYSTIGLDVNPWSLQQAAFVAPQTPFCMGSVEDLPFADNLFDVVIIKHVVEHLPRPDRAIQELGRILAPAGRLILSAPNLASLLKPLKGEKWIGYQDPTHISLKTPEEWLDLLREKGKFRVDRVFSDGFWDTPYIPLVPEMLQKLFFGSLGGFQAITGWIFLPLRWGETMIIIATKED
jgi:ubiquinone/menaquinone biosynthesis C-methylase UbiE